MVSSLVLGVGGLERNVGITVDDAARNKLNRFEKLPWLLHCKENIRIHVCTTAEDVGGTYPSVSTTRCGASSM